MIHCIVLHLTQRGQKCAQLCYCMLYSLLYVQSQDKIVFVLKWCIRLHKTKEITSYLQLIKTIRFELGKISFTRVQSQ